MNRTLSRKFATSRPLHTRNPFDQVEVHSINSMDRILEILNSAQQNSSAENEPFKFGKQIFEYSLVRFLNKRNIILRDSRTWNGTRSMYKEFLRDSIEDYNDLTSCDNGRNYLTIVNKFVRNDVGCLRNMEESMQKMINLSPKKFDHRFPSWKIPGPPSNHMNTKYILQTTPDPKKNPLSVLPFLVNDPFLIHQVIQKYQLGNKLPESPYPMINSLMESQEYEGEILFSILVRRTLYRHPYLQTDFIKDKFLNHPNKLKVILCHQTALLSRLQPLRVYRDAFTKVRVTNKARLMANTFNRFIAVLYLANRNQVLTWLEELMVYYHNNRISINDNELYSHAMSYIDDLQEVETPSIYLNGG